MLYADVVIPPSYIKLSEEGAAGKAIDGLGNEGRDIAILLGPTVDWVVVLDGTKFAIFLLDKKEIGGVGTPRFSDSSPSEVFCYELVDFLYFELGERE